MDILEECVDEIQLKSEVIDDPKPLSTASLEIIEDDGSLSDDQADTLAQAQAILDADGDVPFQFKSDNGVMYRVYQVNPEDHEAESVASDYQPNTTIQPVVLTSNSLSNHIYVVGNDVITQHNRSLAPRVENRTGPISSSRVRRDDRRRATHNEVERRRRDKINNWILKLSKIIPDCSSLDNSKSVQSKGCILAKACEYIVELRQSGQKLAECMKENERLTNHIEYLTTVTEKLKTENMLLRRRNGAPSVVEGRPSEES